MKLLELMLIVNGRLIGPITFASPVDEHGEDIDICPGDQVTLGIRPAKSQTPWLVGTSKVGHR